MKNLFFIFFLLSCAAPRLTMEENEIQNMATFDLNCSSDMIRFERKSEEQIVATGCGRKKAYIIQCNEKKKNDCSVLRK